MNYKKFWEYKCTIYSTSEDEFTRFMHDPRINKICVCKDHYIANQRFYKNIRRPNRVRNVQYTLECYARHLQKKRRK